MTRRDWLRTSHLGLGALAFENLCAQAAHQAKAKRCIFLFMEGGVSQMDLFEHKPELTKRAGQRMPQAPGTVGEIATFSAAPNRIVPPVAPLGQHGQSGRWMTSLMPHLAKQADHLAFIHGIKVDNNNHGPAVYHTLTGNQFPGSASVGAWVTYGLGSANHDLPSFIVLGDRRGATIGGAGVWGNGYLPAAFQGTLFRHGATPIVDLHRRRDVPESAQRAELDALKYLNEQHAAARLADRSELDARLASYELAFRMQSKAPELVDLSRESEATRKLYGFDDPTAEPFGRQCLLARRMVERGVRFVMVLHGAGGDRWDDHGDVQGRIPRHCREVDQPVAGLLADLHSRGLLEETLVVWASEMGRTPFDNNLITDKPGRDHNQYALCVWMAGGNIKGGATAGATDDFSVRAAQDEIPLRDVHATILHALGLDQNRLTYLHAGRYKKLTDIGGRVRTEILT